MGAPRGNIGPTAMTGLVIHSRGPCRLPWLICVPASAAWWAALGGGRSVLQRLASMGFTPGASVEVIQNYGWGPLIVMTRGARVALGRGEARHVTVEREAP